MTSKTIKNTPPTSAPHPQLSSITPSPTVPLFKGRVFMGRTTLQPTLVGKTFWYREISTTSAVEPENSPITYAQFAIKLKVTEVTRTLHTSISLFLGFAPLSPLPGNCMVGPITLSSGVPFRHVAAAHPEGSMMNLIQTANPAVHRTLRDKAAQRPVASTLDGFSYLALAQGSTYVSGIVKVVLRNIVWPFVFQTHCGTPADSISQPPIYFSCLMR